MSREILFKAKRKDWRELPKMGWWVEGYVIRDDITGQAFIHAQGNSVNESQRIGEEGCLRFFAYEIDPETFCQYTVVPDKNGEGIWEYDILKSTASEDKREWKLWKVVFVDGSFIFTPLAYVEKTRKKLKCEDEVLCKDNVELYGLERVGNIFDNPELLGGA